MIDALIENVHLVGVVPGLAERVCLNDGIEPPNGVDRVFPYKRDAFVPKPHWRALTRDEYQLLTACASPSPSDTVRLVPAPAPLMELAGELGLSKLVSQEEAEQLASSRSAELRKFLAMARAFGESFLTRKEGFSMQFLRCEAHVGLRSSTLDQTTGQYIGLHVDNWDGLPMNLRSDSRARLILNLGSEPRFVVFINLTIARMADMIAAAGNLPADADSYDAIGNFFSIFPGYPVIRVRVDPGEAYIAPVDNLFHDGTTSDKRAADVTLSMLGHFGVKVSCSEGAPASAGWHTANKVSMPVAAPGNRFLEDRITALPPAGDNHSYWQDSVLQSRSADLRKLGELFGEHLPVRELLSFSPQTQQRFMLTSEFGHWISWMKRRLQSRDGGGPGPSLEALKMQTGYFLLTALLQEPDRGPCELALPLVSGRFMPLAGSDIFFNLADESPPCLGRTRCSVNASELLFQQKGIPPTAISTDEVRGAGSDLQECFTLTGLPIGAYRLPRLPRLSTLVGLPVSSYYGACLAEMSGGSDESRHVRFSENVSSPARDLSAAVSLLSESWQEMGSAFDLHVKVVVPLESDMVLSYSESAAPNVLFVRANPLNPLWYVELLVHEWAHTWLATLLESFRIVRDDDRSQFSSPWRADKRPIQGVLFATHAFAMVAVLLHRQLGRGLVEDPFLVRRIVFEADRVNRGNEILREYRGFTSGGRILVESLGVLVEEVLRRRADCSSPATKVPNELVDRIWPTAIRDE